MSEPTSKTKVEKPAGEIAAGTPALQLVSVYAHEAVPVGKDDDGNVIEILPGDHGIMDIKKAEKLAVAGKVIIVGGAE